MSCHPAQPIKQVKRCGRCFRPVFASRSRDEGLCGMCAREIKRTNGYLSTRPEGRGAGGGV